MENNSNTIFKGGDAERRLSLPWGRSVEMCWRNLHNRLGRYVLVLVSISVVVAFFVSTLTYQSIVSNLRKTEDVHARSVMQRAGLLSNNENSEKKENDRMTWLLILSGALCFVGVTNTMYMSVMERFREIGTLKCLGALNSFIVRLYMIESVFIGLVGSAIGAVLGCLLSITQLGMMLEFGLLRSGGLFRAMGMAFPVALIGGALLTVLAAVYPTVVASRMKPVDAMRAEI